MITSSIFVRELLEPVFNAILEVMLEGLRRYGFCLPDVMLFAPRSAKVGADIWLEVVPVVPNETMETDHFDVTVQLVVVVVAHSASQDVHFGARSKQDSSSDEVGIEVFFQVGKTIEHLGSSLIIS